MANGRLAHGRIGVLGSGEVGRRLAAGFASRGHDVMIGSRDPGKAELREWLAGDGADIEAGTFAQAAAHGELLVRSPRAHASPRYRHRVGQDRRHAGLLGPRVQAARRLANSPLCQNKRDSA